MGGLVGDAIAAGSGGHPAECHHIGMSRCWAWPETVCPTGIMAQQDIESFPSAQYGTEHGTGLGRKLFGDTFSAALTATLIAPALTLIDRQD